MDDIFCKIVSGEIPAKKVFEDDKILAIEDINPKAKIHFLVFPKEHIATSVDDESADKITQDIFRVTRELARKFKVEESGYRVLTNHSNDAGQSVRHIHFHFLAGEKLKDI